MSARRRRALPMAGLALAAGLAVGLGLWVGALWYGPRVTQAAPQDRALPAGALAPEGPLSIAVFGTSLSSPRYDWPDALAQTLGACLGRPVTLTRVTRAGAGIAWAEGQVDAVRAQGPDLVLMEFSANDADLRDGLRLAEARARTGRVLDALEGIPVVLMTMNPAQGLRGVLRPRLGAHHDAYRALAAARDLGLVDLETRWRQRPRAARGLADGLHPAPEAARGLIVPALAEYLGGAACGGGGDQPLPP